MQRLNNGGTPDHITSALLRLVAGPGTITFTANMQIKHFHSGFYVKIIVIISQLKQ
jgi:hypothetical protein